MTRARLLAVSSIALTTIVLGSCQRVEHAVLMQFFAASRLRDLTALATVSTVVFEPTTDGTVTTFHITDIGPERRTGSEITKDVIVDAPVRMPSGQSVQKTLRVTLRLAARGENSAVDRWMVTGFKDATPAAATPRS